MIVCDSMTMINSDRRRVGFCEDKWQCIYAPVSGPAVVTQRSPEAACHILWASRFDSEKRPELLPLIARRLERQLPSAHIHVHGVTVFGGFHPPQLKGKKNLTFHGAYNGFDSLPTDAYSIFMYTSYFDGIPNTILEAMSHGLASYLESWFEVERLRKVEVAQNAEMEHLRGGRGRPDVEIERLKKVEAEHKAEIDYYRELASVSEERAREIRRIAAAHIRHASGNGFVTRVLRVFRTIAASGWRAEGEDRGPIWAARRR